MALFLLDAIIYLQVTLLMDDEKMYIFVGNAYMNDVTFS